MSRRLLPLVLMTAVLAVTALVRTVRMHMAQSQASTSEQTRVQMVGMPVEEVALADVRDDKNGRAGT